MNALTLDALCDRIASAKSPLILMHCRPDGDTVGSAAAMMRIFLALGEAPRCLCADPIPHRLAFLTKGLDTTPPDLTLPHTVITVDVASPPQLGSLSECMTGRLAPSLMIDHHERGEAYADHYVRPDAAATGEIVYEIAARMSERGLLPGIDTEIASLLYAAISSDTGCFKFSNVTERTHRIAAHLISLGVNAAEINRRLFDVKSIGQITAEGYVGSHVLLHPSGKIAWTVITHAERDALGLLDEHFETAIDVVRSIEGVEVALAVKETADGRYKISLRSVGLDVAAIAAALGGGGHQRAAGCSLTAPTGDAAAATVVDMICTAIGEKYRDT